MIDRIWYVILYCFIDGKEKKDNSNRERQEEREKEKDKDWWRKNAESKERKNAKLIEKKERIDRERWRI